MGRGAVLAGRVVVATLAAALLGGGAGANTWHPLGPWGGEVRGLAADGASWYEYAATWGAGVFRRLPGSAWQPVGTDVVHHRAYHVELAGLGSPRVFAATAGGLFSSADGGESWTVLPLPATDVRVVRVDPTNPMVVYAGTAGGGVYKSVDGGSTWNACNSGLTSLNLNLFINGIAVAGEAPQRLYLASEGGIFRSQDGGDSWLRIGFEVAGAQGSGVKAVAVDSSRPGTVYAGLDGALWSSPDHGASWVAAYADSEVGVINAIAADVATPGTVLAATSGRGVLRSLDWGATWLAFDSGLPDIRVLALARRESDGAWLAGAAPGGVYRRVGSATAWSGDTTGIPNFTVRSVSTPAAGGQQTRLAVATTNGFFWRAPDGLRAAPEPLRGAAVTALAGDDPTMVGTAELGVFRCTWDDENGPACTAVNEDLADLHITCLASDGLEVWAATRSAGVFRRSLAEAGSWMAAGLVGVGVNALFPHAGTWLAGTDEGLRSSNDRGLTWVPVAGGLPGSRILALAAHNGSLFASVAMGGVYRSDDGGGSWARASGGLGSTLAMALAADAEVLYAGTVNAGVYRSVDGGESWNAVNDGLFNPRVTALAVNPDGAVFTGTEGSGVFALIESSACLLTCNAVAPTSGIAGLAVAFHAQVAASGCASSPVHTWTFDDGSAPATGAAVEHVFASSGSYQWTLSASADGVSCTTTGIIVIEVPPPLYRSYVAAVAHAPGAGSTQWRTNLAVVNRTTVPAEAVLTFLPYTGGGAPVERRTTISVLGTVEWEDVLVSLFGFSAAASIKGSVEIVSSTPLIITSRTYNQAAQGSFGQYYPAVAAGGGYGPGVSAIIPQLKKNGNFRSNVGVLNVGEGTASVEARIFNPLGQQVGATVQRDVPAGRYWQWDDILGSRYAAAGTMDSAYAVVKVLSAGDRVWSYGSVVDNATGDPTTVPGLAGIAVDAFFLPSVAHAPGAGGTQWRTNVAVVNPAAAAADFTLTFFPYAGGGTILETSVRLGPGATVEWVDILVSLFGMNPASSLKGSVRVAANGPLVLGSRTYNQTSAGTFGQYYPAVSGWDALPPGATGTVAHLKKTPAFRSNLGVLNLGSEEVRVGAGLRDATGAPVGVTVFADVPPGRYWQWDDVFSSRYTGAGEHPLAYAVVEHLAGNSPVWCYGSVVDNATGDPTTIPFQQ